MLEHTPIEPRALLSPREVQVLEMAALGLSNGQMAVRLNVSVHAIKFHLAAVYRKLGVSNRTEAAVRYLQSGGLTSPSRDNSGSE